MKFLKDVKIMDNVVITPNSLLSLCSIEPIDVSLLTEDERDSFESNIRKSLHSLGTNHAQIVVRTRNATVLDLQNHFRSFYNLNMKKTALDNIRAQYIENYLKEMKSLVSSHQIPIQEFFLILEIKSNTKNNKSLVEGIERLERLTNQVTAHLKQAKVETKLIDSDGIQKFFESSFTSAL